MGLFCAVIHIYQRSQEEVIQEVSKEWKENYQISTIERMEGGAKEIEAILGGKDLPKSGVDYLITTPHGNWTTIIEVNANTNPSFYLTALVNNLSRRLDTYALSIYLHDSDVLYYNLANRGQSLDGYNSDCQYFLSEPADKAETLDQRHEPSTFEPLLRRGKTAKGLNAILNEGYWAAFDNGDLDEDGVPIEDDKYMIDEHERFGKLGKYLEIYTPADYPFVDWYGNSGELIQAGSCLLRGLQ